MSKKLIVVIIVLVIIILGIVAFLYFRKDTPQVQDNETSGNYVEETHIQNNEIPDNYIAVFNGGSGELTYSTYIYKIENGLDNSGYKYINTMNSTTSYGSSEWNHKITGEGTVQWTDEVFEKAKENGAYSYVLYNEKTYTIEEFMEIFLKN